MNDIKSTPYHWLASLDPALLQLDESPLLGNPPPFPWEVYSRKLAELFQIESIKIEAGELKWRSVEELYSDLGDHLKPLNFSISSFDGEICWVMAEDDIDQLMSMVLTKEVSPLLQKIPSDFQMGFYQFLAIEAINNLRLVEFDRTLSPHILDKEELLKGNALALDIKISIFDETFFGRMLITPEFRKSWKEHFSKREMHSHSRDHLSQKALINVHIIAGKMQMQLPDWKQISPGDFVFLDKCTIEPEPFKGKVFLALEDGTLILEALYRQGTLKILGIPQFQEKETIMETNNNHSDYEEEFSEEEEGEIEELEEEEEIDEETPPQEEVVFEEEPKEEAEQEPALAPFESPIVSPDKIPVIVTVEIGRVQMSLQKLLDLQPGNLLDLHLQPESGVNLIVNGKCVGKGELLKIGKTLGVRILDLG